MGFGSAASMNVSIKNNLNLRNGIRKKFKSNNIDTTLPPIHGSSFNKVKFKPKTKTEIARLSHLIKSDFRKETRVRLVKTFVVFSLLVFLILSII